MLGDLLLSVILSVTAAALGDLRLDQWPADVSLPVGSSVTFYCVSEGKLGQCRPNWYVPDPETPGSQLEISNAKQYADGFRMLEDPGNYTFLSLRSLQLHHNNTFYCRMSCRVNGRYRILLGTGSQLRITGPPAEERSRERGAPVLWWVGGLFLANGLVLCSAAATGLALLRGRLWGCGEPPAIYAKPDARGSRPRNPPCHI